MAKASHSDLSDQIIGRKAAKERKTRKVSANGHGPRLLVPSNAVELPMTISPYFNEHGFCLLQGDCRDLLAQFPENHFDMVFADPPYMLSNDGFTVHAGKRASVNKGKWDKSQGLAADFQFHLEWIEACKRVLKPEGTIWISGTYHSIYACGYALQLKGYKILNDIAWFKPNASPNLSCRFFTASHETLLWARKSDKAKHVFNYKEMREGDWPDDSYKKPGKQMRSAWHIDKPKEWYKKQWHIGDPRKDSLTIWDINTPRPDEKSFGKHPTQKPIELLNRIILASTNPGALILDPFAGSSTTGLAAVQNGRRFVGIDMEKKYLDLSVKRLNRLIDSGNQQLDFTELIK